MGTCFCPEAIFIAMLASSVRSFHFKDGKKHGFPLKAKRNDHFYPQDQEYSFDFRMCWEIFLCSVSRLGSGAGSCWVETSEEQPAIPEQQKRQQARLHEGPLLGFVAPCITSAGKEQE